MALTAQEVEADHRAAMVADVAQEIGDEVAQATAERGSCARIWSEDLSASQNYFDILVENPFA